ncbi:MAG: DUF177 domain-containing protein [Bacteroidales bacterium]|nr:DUF177 domain-containing protein [Bacteroidales bacterium]
MDESYIIPLNDLKSGVHAYCWDVSNEFFEGYDNVKVNAASLHVEAQASRKGSGVDVDCRIDGTIMVPCDRCLGDMVIDVDTDATLRFRFGQEPEIPVEEEDGREVVWIPEGETAIDLSQVIYDYSLLSVPIQHCHAEGECDSVVSRYLNPSGESAVEMSDSPFASLKGLFDK